MAYKLLRKHLKSCGLLLLVANIVIVVFIGNMFRIQRVPNEKRGAITGEFLLNTNTTRNSTGDTTTKILQRELPLKTTNSFPTILRIEKEPKKYNLLINAYMNSGSRFTGSLFGFRKDAFFFYEPLWKASVWDYYRAPNLACNSVRDSCKNSTAVSVNKYIRAVDSPGNKSINELLLGVLEKIYRCDFSHFDTLVVKEISEVASLSGPSWDTFRACIKTRRTAKKECIRREEDLCKKAKHIVTKVLRMTVGSLEPLLRTFPNLKIIHLMRDPRAIINSRMYSAGYPGRDLVANSKALCRKMTWDVVEGQALLKKYPNRFKFAFYEDVKSDVLRKSEQLSNFIGMEYKSSEVSGLNKVKVNKANVRNVKVSGSRVADNAFWWRTSLSVKDLVNIQRDCEKVFKTFDLRIFKSKADLMNISISTFIQNM